MILDQSIQGEQNERRSYSNRSNSRDKQINYELIISLS